MTLPKPKVEYNWPTPKDQAKLTRTEGLSQVDLSSSLVELS